MLRFKRARSYILDLVLQWAAYSSFQGEPALKSTSWQVGRGADTQGEKDKPHKHNNYLFKTIGIEQCGGNTGLGTPRLPVVTKAWGGMFDCHVLLFLLWFVTWFAKRSVKISSPK